MIKRKIAAIFLTFGLVFTNVLFVNADETRRLVDTKVDTIKDAFKDLTKAEAEAKKEELEASDGDETEFKITATIRSYLVGTGEYVKIEVKEVFTSKEAAESYANDLVKQGFTIRSKSIFQNSHSETVEINQVFGTREEAEEALSKFIKDNNLDASKVSSTIEKVYNPNKNGPETLFEKGSTSYDTERDAIEAIKNINSEDDEFIISGKIRKAAKSTIITQNVKSAQFNTRKEAEDYIADLKKQGYDTGDLEVKLVSFEASIWGDEVVVNPGASDSTAFSYGHFDVSLLSRFKKIDSEGKESTVTGRMTISTVTIAGKNIAMSLTRDPNRNDTEYASKTRHGLNVTNKSLVKITGTITFGNTTLPFEVEGYLSEKQNVCRGNGDMKGFDLEFESVTIIENRVIIDTKLVTKYQVVGTVSKTETAEIYYVDTYKIAKGYDYVLTAEGEKEVLEDTYTLSLTADKELTEEKYALDVTKETYIYEDIKGDLIVRYITIFNETLSPDEKSTEKVGTDYKTEQKEFEYYKLVEIRGNETGKYIDATIEVVYVYEFVGGTGGNDEPIDPNFPATGVETNNALEYTLLISLISLVGSIIVRKKLN